MLLYVWLIATVRGLSNAQVYKVFYLLYCSSTVISGGCGSHLMFWILVFAQETRRPSFDDERLKLYKQSAASSTDDTKKVGVICVDEISKPAVIDISSWFMRHIVHDPVNISGKRAGSRLQLCLTTYWVWNRLSSEIQEDVWDSLLHKAFHKACCRLNQMLL